MPVTDQSDQTEESLIDELEGVADDLAPIDDGQDMTDPFDPTQISIAPKQDTLRNLIERLNHNEIDMNTDFQRHAELWQPGQMSRLIESILIRFPLPAFYFDASTDDKWLIVDGLQRLSSIKRFVVDKTLKLTQLEYLKDLNGKKYDDLSRAYQRRIDECPVTLFLIQPGTPEQVKYSVFRRINTGGLVLNGQEIRNALARPREREFLQELANDEYLKNTMGDQSKRMLDQELALRFIAFSTQDYFKKGFQNIAEFLDETMTWLSQQTDAKLNELKIVFSRALSFCYQIFGEGAFEKKGRDDIKRRRKNSTLFEVWTVTIAKQTDITVQSLVTRKTEIQSRMQDLVETDEPFYRSISLATQKRDAVRTRFDRIEKIIQEFGHD